ncbi:MAG: trypsin-like peptidase domain-containing protein [Armatimonadetes bacterium]|nr:trypsin-like peptidase domain-containing protein [Armatimonadota bacterium]
MKQRLMWWYWGGLLIFFGVVLGKALAEEAPVLSADVNAAIAAKVKPSVAFLTVSRQCDGLKVYDGKKAMAPQPNFGSSGSAFVVSKEGLLVTNAHVVNPDVRFDIFVEYSMNYPKFRTKPDPRSAAFAKLARKDNYGDTRIKGKARIIAVFFPGTPEEKVYTASTLYSDEETDIAVLKLEGKGSFVPMAFADSEQTKEQEAVIAFGFPFGKSLASSPKASYPQMDTADGRVRTSEVNPDTGKVEKIRHNAEIAPGSSGGPLVNQQGDVIGVNRAGLGAAAINYAIPSNLVTGLLRKWKVPFQQH